MGCVNSCAIHHGSTGSGGFPDKLLLSPDAADSETAIVVAINAQLIAGGLEWGWVTI